MKTLSRLLCVVVRPRRTSREILAQGTLGASLSIVLGFAVVLSLLMLVSHVQGDYPPPPEDLDLWIDAWGEFAMLPFVKVPARHYRLAQAAFFTPLVVATWVWMAGSARLLSLCFGGRVTYKQYLILYSYSFFSFWIAASLLDVTYSGLCGDFVLRALRNEYGPAVRKAVIAFPAVMWTAAMGLGGVYNAIVTQASEGCSWPKAALTGLATFAWPMALISILVR